MSGRADLSPLARVSAAEIWEESHFLASGEDRVISSKKSSGLERDELVHGFSVAECWSPTL